MKDVTRKPICFLGQPCFDAECDYCNARKLAAVRKSARSAFFPEHPDGRVVIGILGWYQHSAFGFKYKSLPPELRKVCLLANLKHERVLAGSHIGYRSKGPGYVVRWAFVIGLSRRVRVASLAGELKTAFTELVGDETFQASFEEGKPGPRFDDLLEALFKWNWTEVRRCLGVTPRQHGAAVDDLLNSIRSSDRIYSQNVERTADGLFLPSPYGSAKSRQSALVHRATRTPGSHRLNDHGEDPLARASRSRHRSIRSSKDRASSSNRPAKVRVPVGMHTN